MNQRLTFGDGFLFGCGFYTAAVVAGVVFALIFTIVSLVLIVLGIGATIPILSELGSM